MEHESLQAELAIKTSLVEALNAENEQLRHILQKHADQADAETTSRLARGDMRRESNINELQVVIAHMRSQLYEHASDHDAQTTTLAELRRDNADLRAEKGDMMDEMNALKQRLTIMQAQLAEEQAKYDDERAKVLALRAGMEESKKAIAILKEQSDRRNSDVAIRRLSESQGGAARVASLVNVNVNVSEARRGSINYLTGLGLTSKRLGHFDPSKKSPFGTSKTESDLASLASGVPLPPSEGAASPSTLNRRASLPASPAHLLSSPGQSGFGLGLTGSPQFASTSRRASLTAGRRTSIGYDTPTRRNASLSHALIRLNGMSGEDGDLPLGRRESTTIDEEGGATSFTALPEMGVRRRRSGERRRSSVHGQHPLRRGSDKPIPRMFSDYSLTSSTSTSTFTSALDEEDEAPPSTYQFPPTVIEEGGLSPSTSVSVPMSMRTNTYPPHEPEGVVQALSMEAAMEISDLKELISDLKMQLFEAEESREASETCARVLREFIATQASVAQPESVKLPPLPTDADAEAEQSQKAAEPEKETKRASRWGMPKLLPTLSYSSIRRDASNSIVSHLPAIIGKSASTSQLAVPAPPTSATPSPVLGSKSSSSGSPSLLQQPGWRTNGDLRHLSVCSVNSSTGAPSPVLSSGVPNFQSTFNGFSFNGFQAAPAAASEDCASPCGSRADSPTFSSVNDGASSTDESEAESLPVTPMDATFGSRAGSVSMDAAVQKQRREEEERIASDPTMTPRAVHAF